jgi:hypothetical protein
VESESANSKNDKKETTMKKLIPLTLLLTAALCLVMLALCLNPTDAQAWPSNNMLGKNGFAMTDAITRNPSFFIQYTLPYYCQVTMIVYDITGRQVKTLVNTQMGAGDHYVVFDGAGRSAGVYFYTMQAGSFFGVGRLILLK